MYYKVLEDMMNALYICYILKFTVARYIGIDFSGDVEQWRPNRIRSNVWIALARRHPTGFEVERLFRVQDCAKGEMTKSPFSSLLDLLRGTDFVAAGIRRSFFGAIIVCPSGRTPGTAGQARQN